MTDTRHTHDDPCQKFLENLDLWLGQELDSRQSDLMQTHHDACPGCQLEARLAGEIDAITQLLPPLQCPELQLPVAKKSGARAVSASHGFLAQLLATWRQPLVFGPALALMLITGLFIQEQLSNAPDESQVIVVNGQEYTPEEVIQAAQNLELALEYLNKYSLYAASLVSSELRATNVLPSSSPDDAEVPTI